MLLPTKSGDGAISAVERGTRIPSIDNYTLHNRGLTFEHRCEINEESNFYPFTTWEFKTSGNLTDQINYLTSSPTPVEGTYCLETLVRPGDVVTGTTGERVEGVLNPSHDWPGTEKWTKFAFQLPVGFTMPAQWLILNQVHPDSRFGQASMKFHAMATSDFSVVLTCGPFANSGQALSPIEGNNVRFNNLFPYNLGQWHWVIFGTRYSSVGMGKFVCLHKMQGAQTWDTVIDATGLYTVPMITGDTNPGVNYFKFGPYRNVEGSLTTQVFYDALVRGNSKEEVMNTDVTNFKPRESIAIYGPAQTNLCQNSDFDTGIASWISQSGAVLTWEQAHPIFGKCLKVDMPTLASSESAKYAVTLTNGNVYKGDVWVIGRKGFRVKLQPVDNGNNNISGAVNITCTGYPQKIEVNFTANASQPTQMRVSRTGAGAQTETIYIKGACLVDAGTTPLHLPRKVTDGGSAQLTPGHARWPATGLNPSNGTLLAVIEPSWFYNAGPRWDAAPTSSSWGPMVFYYGTTADPNNALYCYYREPTASWVFTRVGNGTSHSVSVVSRFYPDDRLKIACAWTPTTIKISVGQQTPTSIGDTSIPTITMPKYLQVGGLDNDTLQLCGDVYWIAAGRDAFNDANIDTLFGLNFKDNAAFPPSHADLPFDCLWAGGAQMRSGVFTAETVEAVV